MSESTLSVNIDGKPVELFMSYGLLTELARTAPHIDALPSLDLDNDLRDRFLSTLIAERTKTGKVITPREIAEVDISIPDVELALDWGKEHLVDFFLRRVGKAHESGGKIRSGLAQFSSDGTAA